MKVIILTNLFPYEANLSGGIFITKRLEQYKKLGIDYVAVPVWFQDDPFARSQRVWLEKAHSFWPRTLKETTLSSIHAQVCGCRVLMENHKANRERALDERYLYQPEDLNDAACRLRKLVEEYDFSRKFPDEAWLKRFDYNWQVKKLIALINR